MYADYALYVVGNEGETVLHGVETRLATVGDGVLHGEVVLTAELLPVVLLCFGQHKYDAQLGGVLTKAFQRAHQYWFAADGQKLLGYVTAHSQSLPTGNDDYVIHKSLITLLNIMPSRSALAAAGPFSIPTMAKAYGMVAAGPQPVMMLSEMTYGANSS